MNSNSSMITFFLDHFIWSMLSTFMLYCISGLFYAVVSFANTALSLLSEFRSSETTLIIKTSVNDYTDFLFKSGWPVKNTFSPEWLDTKKWVEPHFPRVSPEDPAVHPHQNQSQLLLKYRLFCSDTAVTHVVSKS